MNIAKDSFISSHKKKQISVSFFILLLTTSFCDVNILIDCGNGKILKFYRIVANRDINNPHGLIKKGEKGGYIVEGALSQEDESWVDSKSIVGPDCYIGGNGYVEDSMLFHSVRVGNSGAIISSKVMPKTITTVFGGSMICDCQINGDVVLSGEARLDSCSVEGHLSMTPTLLCKIVQSRELKTEFLLSMT